MQNYTNSNRIIIAMVCTVQCIYEVDFPKPLKCIRVEDIQIEFCRLLGGIV